MKKDVTIIAKVITIGLLISASVSGSAQQSLAIGCGTMVSARTAQTENSSLVSNDGLASIVSGEHWTASPVFVDNNTSSSAKGVVIDPLQADFEMFTSKIVLLRVSCQRISNSDLVALLSEIASADPRGIIIISTDERENILLTGENTFSIPIVQIASGDSTAVIRAAQDRKLVSIQLK